MSRYSSRYAKGKSKEAKGPSPDDGDVPLAMPDTTASRASGKPLIALTEADLRAAGVEFTEVNANTPLAGRNAGAWVEEIELEGGEEEYANSDLWKWRSEDEKTKSKRRLFRQSKGGNFDNLEEDGEDESDGEGYDESIEDGEADDEDEEENNPELEAFWDEFFDALTYTVPFSFLYLMLDILTNLSYSLHQPFSHYLRRYLLSAPTIGIIVFYSEYLAGYAASRHAADYRCRALLFAACVACGTRLIWLVNKASYKVTLAQGPAMGTLWILTIVQLPLTLAVPGLVAVAAWMHQTGMKLLPR